MKNPVELWDDLQLLGKLCSWWIIPVYYITYSAFFLIAAIFIGVYSAWHDFSK